MKITGALLFIAGVMYPQQSLDFLSTVQCAQNSRFRLNSFEGNSSNLYSGKDWEISALLSGYSQNSFKTNLFSISLGKRLDDHFFYARFSPGYSEEFLFNTGLQVIIKEPVRVETDLQKKISYNEDFGLGYSYTFNSSFNLGFTLRHVKQQFEEEQPEPVLTDTLNYILISKKNTNSNFWRGDVGLFYRPANWLSFSISSSNLFIINENEENSDTDLYSVRKRKDAILQARGNFFPGIESFLSYETGGSFTVGSNYSFRFSNSNVTFGLLAFHDKNQVPFIAGVMPSINYSTKLFSLTLSGIKYFMDRNVTRTISELTSSGIDNISNNKFSEDRVLLGINIALSFVHEQSVRFEDVLIPAEIYPTLADKYLVEPIAIGRVTNISDKPVTIRPASIIPGLNKEKIYSPPVTVGAGNSISVPFYTVINDQATGLEHRRIEQAQFYLELENGTDDEIKKPILVNDRNAWDGSVSNLRYFVKEKLDFSSTLSKKILGENSDKIKNVGPELELFEKTKILFNNVIKNMLYIADKRASTDIVQFPDETITLKGGDCDDLSVCFSSILESVGIETAFVDYKNDSSLNHVNLLVNTKLLPEQFGSITNNDKKIVIRKSQEGVDEIWIPIETTSLTNFETAWSVASEKFQTEAVDQMGLAKGKIQIIDIK